MTVTRVLLVLAVLCALAAAALAGGWIDDGNYAVLTALATAFFAASFLPWSRGQR